MTHTDIARMIRLVLGTTQVQFDLAQNAVDMKDWLEAIIRGELVVAHDPAYVPPDPNDGKPDDPGGDIPHIGETVAKITQPEGRQEL